MVALGEAHALIITRILAKCNIHTYSHSSLQALGALHPISTNGQHASPGFLATPELVPQELQKGTAFQVLPIVRCHPLSGNAVLQIIEGSSAFRLLWFEKVTRIY
ncbi:hypothetical protein AVEN_189348-1 [Araneus ventricosus]|uniref:Uncharacterized protein n=1 Tax=Araneus ventricosus TaxID=182803 RepID=A0A4Y2JWV7_ARAVE|nr:hypothetical protein AVEN_189348-1 [Araneus ventricosus]